MYPVSFPCGLLHNNSSCLILVFTCNSHAGLHHNFSCSGSTVYIIIIMIMIRFVTRTYPPCWVLKARIQKHRGKPLLFHDKCPGFFYVYYTTHGTYSFTSHPKDEAIMFKCLAQGHKRSDRPGRDSNSHSGNART